LAIIQGCIKQPCQVRAEVRAGKGKMELTDSRGFSQALKTELKKASFVIYTNEAFFYLNKIRKILN